MQGEDSIIFFFLSSGICGIANPNNLDFSIYFLCTFCKRWILVIRRNETIMEV